MQDWKMDPKRSYRSIMAKSNRQLTAIYAPWESAEGTPKSAGSSVRPTRQGNSTAAVHAISLLSLVLTASVSSFPDVLTHVRLLSNLSSPIQPFQSSRQAPLDVEF